MTFTRTRSGTDETAAPPPEADAPAPRFAERPRLGADVTVDEAFAAVLRSCLAHWSANLPAACDGRDPEGVHQLRVGLRRQRSAAALLRRQVASAELARLDAEAKALLGVVSPARDWDVFLSGLLAPVEAALPGDPAVAALRRAAAAERRVVYGHARTALLSGRTERLAAETAAFVEGRGWHEGIGPDAAALLARPLAEVAGPLLGRRHQKVLRHGRGFAGLAVPERHAVRIAVKTLRYPAEFFAPLWPARRTDGYLKALRRLQDVLGRMNDAAVAEALIQGLIREAGPRRAAGLRRGAGLVVGWHAHAAVALEAEAVRRWRRFAAARPFWDRPAAG